MPRYELALLLVPTISEKERQQMIKDLSGWIGKDGLVSHIDDWGKRPLAYTIDKHSQAIYLFIELSLEPNKIAKVAQNLGFKSHVLRHMLVRKENKLKAKEKEGLRRKRRSKTG